MRSASPSSPRRNRKRASLPAGSGAGLSLDDDQGVPLPMTVHEMALRARLERALGDTVRRERRSSNEVRDEDGAWPWRERERERLSTPSSSRSPSPSSSFQPHQHQTPTRHTHLRRNTTTNSPSASLKFPTPTRPPRSPSKYTPGRTLLTPPPTPPSHFRSSTAIGIGRPSTTRRSTSRSTRSGSAGSQVSMSEEGLSTSSLSEESPITGYKYPFSPSHPPSSAPPLLATTRPFNARTASEQLRHTQGYVSFSSIEGCEPPETPVESPADLVARGRGRAGSWIALGLGVKGFGWVFGKDGTEVVEEGVVRA